MRTRLQSIDIRVGGRKLFRNVQLVNGLVVMMPGKQSISQAEVKGAVVGREFQRSAILHRGFAKHIFVAVRGSANNVNVARVAHDALSQRSLFQGGLRLMQIETCVRQAQMCFSVIGLVLQSRFKIRCSLLWMVKIVVLVIRD